MRRWLPVVVVLALAGAWLGTRSHPAASLASAPRCPAPDAFAGEDGAVQTDVPGDIADFPLGDARAHPLAGFSVAARVLSREDYRHGREADYSPMDLALGWGRMRDDAVLQRLSLSQSLRYYRYGWRDDPPIPPDEIVRSSANMHLIPADATVAAALDGVAAGDRVRIDGWLVRIDASDGWRWTSSLSREDSGGGACELVYVCTVTRR